MEVEKQFSIKSFKKIKISTEASYRLSQMKGKTGLTPNILARFALCHSLKNPKKPDLEYYNSDGMEFNRYTLTGEFDSLIINLLKQWLKKNDLNEDEKFIDYLRAHICRGAHEIFPKIKGISDLGKIL